MQFRSKKNQQQKKTTSMPYKQRDKPARGGEGAMTGSGILRKYVYL